MLFRSHLGLGGQERQVGVGEVTGLHAALGRGAQHARDPRVRVLHVEDGVVHRLASRELEIDLDRGVPGAREQQEPRRVGPDLVEEVIDLRARLNDGIERQLKGKKALWQRRGR